MTEDGVKVIETEVSDQEIRGVTNSTRFIGKCGYLKESLIYMRKNNY